jgi:hypothetical protein
MDPHQSKLQLSLSKPSEIVLSPVLARSVLAERCHDVLNGHWQAKVSVAECQRHERHDTMVDLAIQCYKTVCDDSELPSFSKGVNVELSSRCAINDVDPLHVAVDCKKCPAKNALTVSICLDGIEVASVDYTFVVAALCDVPLDQSRYEMFITRDSVPRPNSCLADRMTFERDSDEDHCDKWWLREIQVYLITDEKFRFASAAGAHGLTCRLQDALNPNRALCFDSQKLFVVPDTMNTMWFNTCDDEEQVMMFLYNFLGIISPYGAEPPILDPARFRIYQKLFPTVARFYDSLTDDDRQSSNNAYIDSLWRKNWAPVAFKEWKDSGCTAQNYFGLDDDGVVRVDSLGVPSWGVERAADQIDRVTKHWTHIRDSCTDNSVERALLTVEIERQKLWLAAADRVNSMVAGASLGQWVMLWNACEQKAVELVEGVPAVYSSHLWLLQQEIAKLEAQNGECSALTLPLVPEHFPFRSVDQCSSTAVLYKEVWRCPAYSMFWNPRETPLLIANDSDSVPCINCDVKFNPAGRPEHTPAPLFVPYQKDHYHVHHLDGEDDGLWGRFCRLFTTTSAVVLPAAPAAASPPTTTTTTTTTTPCSSVFANYDVDFGARWLTSAPADLPSVVVTTDDRFDYQYVIDNVKEIKVSDFVLDTVASSDGKEYILGVGCIVLVTNTFDNKPLCGVIRERMNGGKVNVMSFWPDQGPLMEMLSTDLVATRDPRTMLKLLKLSAFKDESLYIQTAESGTRFILIDIRADITKDLANTDKVVFIVMDPTSGEVSTIKPDAVHETGKLEKRPGTLGTVQPMHAFWYWLMWEDVARQGVGFVNENGLYASLSCNSMFWLSGHFSPGLLARAVIVPIDDIVSIGLDTNLSKMARGQKINNDGETSAVVDLEFDIDYNSDNNDIEDITLTCTVIGETIEEKISMKSANSTSNQLQKGVAFSGWVDSGTSVPDGQSNIFVDNPASFNGAMIYSNPLDGGYLQATRFLLINGGKGTDIFTQNPTDKFAHFKKLTFLKEAIEQNKIFQFQTDRDDEDEKTDAVKPLKWLKQGAKCTIIGWTRANPQVGTINFRILGYYPTDIDVVVRVAPYGGNDNEPFFEIHQNDLFPLEYGEKSPDASVIDTKDQLKYDQPAGDLSVGMHNDTGMFVLYDKQSLMIKGVMLPGGSVFPVLGKMPADVAAKFTPIGAPNVLGPLEKIQARNEILYHPDSENDNLPANSGPFTRQWLDYTHSSRKNLNEVVESDEEKKTRLAALAAQEKAAKELAAQKAAKAAKKKAAQDIADKAKAAQDIADKEKKEAEEAAKAKEAADKKAADDEAAAQKSADAAAAAQKDADAAAAAAAKKEADDKLVQDGLKAAAEAAQKRAEAAEAARQAAEAAREAAAAAVTAAVQKEEAAAAAELAALASLSDANQKVIEAQEALINAMKALTVFNDEGAKGGDDDEKKREGLNDAIIKAQKFHDDLVVRLEEIKVEVDDAKKLHQEATSEKNKIAPSRSFDSYGITMLTTKIEIGFVQRFNFLATKPSQVASESKSIVIKFPGNDPDRQDVEDKLAYFHTATIKRFQEFRTSSSSVESVVLFPPFSTGMNLGSAQQQIKFDGKVNFPVCELNLDHGRETSFFIMPVDENADILPGYSLSSIAPNFSSINLFSVYQDLTFVGEYRPTNEIVTIRFFVRKDVNRRRFMLVGASVVKQIIS